MEQGRQTQEISRVATSIRCRWSGSGGMGAPHRSQRSSGTVSSAALLPASSWAKRRSAEKPENLLSRAIGFSADHARRGDLHLAVFADEQRDGLQVQQRVV